MGLFGYSSSKSTFPWSQLTSMEQLRSLFNTPNEVPFLIFKHSTRCSISSMALNRFENEWDQSTGNIEMFYLDLLEFRAISNEIAQLTGVEHQSPQAILIKDGKVIYHASHSGISAKDILNIL